MPDWLRFDGTSPYSCNMVARGRVCSYTGICTRAIPCARMHSIPHPFRVYSPPEPQGTSATVSGEERAFAQMDSLYRRLVGYLPEAVYCCDLNGRITLFNDAALRLWGRVPELGVDRWCGAYRIFLPDGTPLSHEQSAMASLLLERQERGSAESLIERPDGTRRVVLSHPQLVKEGGVVLGAVNVIIDIT